MAIANDWYCSRKKIVGEKMNFFLKQNIKDCNLGMSIIKEKKHVAVRIFKNLLLMIYFHELKLQSKGKAKRLSQKSRVKNHTHLTD